MEILINEKVTMYVFDHGYIDHERFDCMTNNSYFFASRLKKNTVTREIHSFDLPVRSNMISDKIIYIGTAQIHAKNGFQFVEAMDNKGVYLV